MRDRRQGIPLPVENLTIIHISVERKKKKNDHCSARHLGTTGSWFTRRYTHTFVCPSNEKKKNSSERFEALLLKVIAV